MKTLLGTISAALCAGLLFGCASVSADKSNSELVLEVFDDVRTGSKMGLDYYSDSEYVQHNLGMEPGGSPIIHAYGTTCVRPDLDACTG